MKVWNTFCKTKYERIAKDNFLYKYVFKNCSVCVCVCVNMHFHINLASQRQILNTWDGLFKCFKLKFKSDLNKCFLYRNFGNCYMYRRKHYDSGHFKKSFVKRKIKRKKQTNKQKTHIKTNKQSIKIHSVNQYFLLYYFGVLSKYI